MPPSGYSPKQSTNIAGFLKSCVDDLVLENRGVRNAPSAIKREIGHIEKDFREHERPTVETKVLELTQAFYEVLLEKAPDDLEDLPRVAEKALDLVQNGILEIHVTDD